MLFASTCLWQVVRSIEPFDDEAMNLLQVSKSKSLEAGDPASPCLYTEAACSAIAESCGFEFKGGGDWVTKGCYLSVPYGQVWYGRIGGKEPQSAAEIGEVSAYYKQARMNTCGQYSEQACLAAATRKGFEWKGAGDFVTEGCYLSVPYGQVWYGRVGGKDAQSAAEIGEVSAYYKQARVDTCDYSTVAPTTEAPTTEAPTTEAPTTVAPTTVAPTTEAPTTEAPTTVAPTTVAPTTDAPTTVVTTEAGPTQADLNAAAQAGRQAARAKAKEARLERQAKNHASAGKNKEAKLELHGKHMATEKAKKAARVEKKEKNHK